MSFSPYPSFATDSTQYMNIEVDSANVTQANDKSAWCHGPGFCRSGPPLLPATLNPKARSDIQRSTFNVECTSSPPITPACLSLDSACGSFRRYQGHNYYSKLTNNRVVFFLVVLCSWIPASWSYDRLLPAIIMARSASPPVTQEHKYATDDPPASATK